MGFSDAGWQILNGEVIPPAGVPLDEAYSFILEAIYDGHLPVYRIIGFSYSSSEVVKATSGNAAVQRYKGCLDDRMTLVGNLTKVLLLHVTGLKPKTAGVHGDMTIDNANISYSGKPIIALSPQKHLMRTYTDSKLEFVVNQSTGYRDAAYNFTRIMEINGANSKRHMTTKTRFMPVYSYHNIVDFVRVFPFDGERIKLAYDYGMNDMYLTELFDDMIKLKSDYNWLQGYGGIIQC